MLAKLSEGGIKVVHELLGAIVLRDVADVELPLTLVVALEWLRRLFVRAEDFSCGLSRLGVLCGGLLGKVAGKAALCPAADHSSFKL